MDEELKSIFSHESKIANLDLSRKAEADLADSERHFLGRVFNGSRSLLDVGCGNAFICDLANVANPELRYTGLDLDPHCISAGRQRFPSAHFIEGVFPESIGNESYDCVLSFRTFYEQVDYRSFLRTLIKASEKYVLFDLRVKFDGPTIVDPELSYFYYHKTGKRVPHIVQNLFELLNFLCIEEFSLKKISIYGYHPPFSSGFVPMKKNEMMVAACLLEKYPIGETRMVTGATDAQWSRDWCQVDINLPGYEKDWF
ncbi:MAG: methyltransferase domain-containing protein [Leptospiraceae bacterium]|nr:methyltransferase domain-containing protein [Leptospiraceae bacterium]